MDRVIGFAAYMRRKDVEPKDADEVDYDNCWRW